jgi:hypothetical protein
MDPKCFARRKWLDMSIGSARMSLNYYSLITMDPIDKHLCFCLEDYGAGDKYFVLTVTSGGQALMIGCQRQTLPAGKICPSPGKGK